jgi:nucleotide-binding universal stress UspA family protein
MFRDLLVHVDGSEAGRRRVQLAIDLALRTGARLSGLHVMPPPDVPPLYKPSQLDEAVVNMSRKLVVNARAAKEAFHDEVAQRLADTRWFEADGDVVDAISDSARYADLVILGQYEWQGPQVVSRQISGSPAARKTAEWAIGNGMPWRDGHKEYRGHNEVLIEDVLWRELDANFSDHLNALLAGED